MRKPWTPGKGLAAGFRPDDCMVSISSWVSRFSVEGTTKAYTAADHRDSELVCVHECWELDSYQFSVYGFATTLKVTVNSQSPKREAKRTVDVSTEAPESTVCELHIDFPSSDFLKTQVV
jgi:hypothetical protein